MQRHVQPLLVDVREGTIMAEEKNRAERNRTLTISQNEINSLKTMISTTKDLNNDSSVENKIFNGDILETLRIMLLLTIVSMKST